MIYSHLSSQGDHMKSDTPLLRTPISNGFPFHSKSVEVPTWSCKRFFTVAHIRHNLGFKEILMLESSGWNVDFTGFMVGALIFAERSSDDSHGHPGLRTTVLHHPLSPALLTLLLSCPPFFLNKAQIHRPLAVSQHTRHTPSSDLCGRILPPVRESLKCQASHTRIPRKKWLEGPWLDSCNFFPWIKLLKIAFPSYISKSVIW